MSRVDAGLSEFILQEHRKKVNIRGIWFMGISFDDPGVVTMSSIA